MNIVDVHTHIFPDKIAEDAVNKIKENIPGMNNFIDATLEGLKKSMQESSISKSVILPVATKPDQIEPIFAFIKSIQDKQIIKFLTWHPQRKDFDTLKNALENKEIKGIKLHPEYQYFYPDDKNMYPIYEIVLSLGKIITFHAGDDLFPDSKTRANPVTLKRILKNFPGLKIVAAHLGGLKIWDDVENELCGENIFFDTAAIFHYLNQQKFEKIVKKHGAEKILFGTDSPWVLQKTGVNYIKKSFLSTTEKEMIFYKNAYELFAI